MFENDTKLEYFISEKNDFLVLSLQGAITKTTLGVFERAQMDFKKSSAQRIVLNFHDVSRIEVSGIPALVKLQKLIRERATELRVCFLKPDFQKMLIEAGAVRPQELSENLLEALKSFAPANKPAATANPEKKAA